MKHLLPFVFLLLSFRSIGQDETIKKLKDESGRTVKKDPADTIKKDWRHGGLYSLNVSQASLTNWAAGGDEFSLAVNSILNLYAFYKKDKHSWDNMFDFTLGYVKTTSLGGRKNDDRFDLLSKYGYALGPKWNAAMLFNLRSQIFRGYSFDNNTKTLTSTFMSPGYILLSLGADYKPSPDLSFFLSPISARWVIVQDTALSNKGFYGVTPGRRSNFEYGAFASVNYVKEFNKNVAYKGRLDLFSNYRRKPGNIDLFMSNTLNVKISRIISATWGVDLIYDDDVRLFGPNKTSPGLQVKSLVGVGLAVRW